MPSEHLRGCVKRSSLLPSSHAEPVPASTVMATSRRRCKQDHNKFCYICGEYTFSQSRRNVTELVKQAHSSYFGISITGEYIPLAPHMMCKYCIDCLRRWKTKSGKSMKFGVPMIWREQTCYLTDCYFCLTKVSRLTNKQGIKLNTPTLL